MGHKAELNRHFSPLAMLGLAFAILNSWTALSASLSLALPSGGPTSVIWGLITAGICKASSAGAGSYDPANDSQAVLMVRRQLITSGFPG